MDSEFDRLLKENDPYKLFGCSYLSNEEDINRIYKKLSLKWHPVRFKLKIRFIG